MFHFYTPWKRQKIRVFLTFPVDIEMDQIVGMAEA